MAEVLVGMGSNIQPEQNLQKAANAIRSEFDEPVFSSVYRSAAVGMAGDDFLNACCMFSSKLTMPEIRLRLKALEDEQGRDRSTGSWKPRTLDLDILMYDAQVVDRELYEHAHAFVPAIELVNISLPKDDRGLLRKINLCL